MSKVGAIFKIECGTAIIKICHNIYILILNDSAEESFLLVFRICILCYHCKCCNNEINHKCNFIFELFLYLGFSICSDHLNYDSIH